MLSLPLLDLGGIWHVTIFIGIALTIARRIQLEHEEVLPLSAKCLLGYVLIRALFILEYPAVHFGPYTHDYMATAGQAFVEALFIPLGALVFAPILSLLITPLALFTSLCVWMNWPGLLAQGSMSFNSAFAAMLMPFLPSWAAWFIILTVFSHHGATGVLIILTQLVVMNVSKRTRARWVGLGLVALAGVMFYLSHTSFSDSGRLVRYREYMTFWASDWRWIVLGVGAGAFHWTALMLDRARDLKAGVAVAPGHFSSKDTFYAMHCDWLQITFDLGGIGLGLAAWVFTSAVKSAWDHPEILATLFGIAVFGLTYHPLRFYPTALLTAYVFLLAFSCKKDSRLARLSSSFATAIRRQS